MGDQPVAREIAEQERGPARGQPGARHHLAGRLAASPWVWRLATLGYAAKGVLYVITGGTVAVAAVQVGGRALGTRGALTLLIALPFGRLVVAVVAAGLCGFILRRFVQLCVPPAAGRPPKLRITHTLRRTGFALSGVAHIGIALTALQLVIGLASLRRAGRAPRDWTTPLLVRQPLNGWLTVLAGLVVLGVAIFYLYMAARRRFTIDLLLEQMSPRLRRVTLALGVAGYAGRGVAFLIVGGFLLYAGWFVEEVEARGLADVLRTLETQTGGVWLLIAVAAGLIAYGVYLLLAARYLRLIATW
jgi:hypothetical protein